MVRLTVQSIKCFNRCTTKPCSRKMTSKGNDLTCWVAWNTKNEPHLKTRAMFWFWTKSSKVHQRPGHAHSNLLERIFGHQSWLAWLRQKFWTQTLQTSLHSMNLRQYLTNFCGFQHQLSKVLVSSFLTCFKRSQRWQLWAWNYSSRRPKKMYLSISRSYRSLTSHSKTIVDR